MAIVAEFISVLRKIRDVIYPEINELYDNSLELKELIDVGKVELDENLGQFNIDYQDFNVKKDEVDAQVLSATNSATNANNSAIMATNKSNEIKAIKAQSATGAPGTSAYASYNPTDGNFTFVIPQGSKGDKGDSFTVNSSGVTASRTLYDNQPTGWSFLDVTTTLLYFKQSNTTAEWSSGVPFGKGDKGDTGEQGVGITSFTFVSTTDISELPAKSGATDTYRVTLIDATTFDYNIYNGLDYSQELLDDKLDKDFSKFTDKTVVINTDVFPIREIGGLIKKLTWDNIKNTLEIYFDTLYLKLTPTIMTGVVSFNSITNEASGTNIGVGVQVGDVLLFSGATDAKNNDIFTVEVINNANSIIVNQAHANKGTSKNLVTRASNANVTVRLLAKWYNAPIGLGQGWVDMTQTRTGNTDYSNPTARSIGVFVFLGNAAVQTAEVIVDGIRVGYSSFEAGTGNAGANGIVTYGSIYKSFAANGAQTVFYWAELR